MLHKELWIDQGRTLRDALAQLNQLPIKILMVQQNGRLTGTLTDGDVRRYLLANGSLEDAVCLAAHPHPQTAASREEGEEMLRRESEYSAIPVVDGDGMLMDVVIAPQAEKTAPAALYLPVVIMAGGKGTRLYPYTKILPKPLIPVGDKPIIEHIMDRFSQYGCEDFHIIVSHKRQLIKAYFSESDHPYQIHWYDEDTPLGTGGGLSLLKGSMVSTFFLINCDILLLADYGEMLRSHRERKNAVTMIAARKRITIPYGVVETGEGGAIKGFREKPSFDFLTNTGMYLVEPQVLEDIADGVPIGFPTIMEQQLAKGRRVGAYEVDEEDWLDMGQLEELQRMEQRLSGR